MGGTLGTAVFLSILFSSVGGKITSSFQAASGTADFQAALRDPKLAADPVDGPVVTAITSGAGLPKGALDDTSFLSKLDDRLARPFLDGFSSAIDLVFLSAAGVLLFAFVIVFFLPEEKLRTMSGIQARQQQEADDAAEAAGALPGHDSSAAAAVSAPSSQMVDGSLVEEHTLDEARVPRQPDTEQEGARR
jgi:hypothetical protein